MKNKMPDIFQDVLAKRFENDPAYKADILLEKAERTDNIKKKTDLINEALQIDTANCDAYNMLAELEKDNSEEQKNIYKKAVELFKKAKGQEYFDNMKGGFWDAPETRPFMRSLNCYADCLRHTGKIKEAIEQYNYLLELNPNDNQGVRYDLINCLFQIGDLQNAERLLDKYKEHIGFFIFDRLILEILKRSRPEILEKLYTQADKANKYVFSYLLGKRQLPKAKTLPSTYSFGSEEEAIIYAYIFRELFRNRKEVFDMLAVLDDKANKDSEQIIQDLTLMLLYLTSWEEKNFDNSKSIVNWKNHHFEILDKLTEKDFTYGSHKSKVIYMTETGAQKAKELLEKYGI
jgi:tetratricopeptide (TPR) repeat protein